MWRFAFCVGFSPKTRPLSARMPGLLGVLPKGAISLLAFLIISLCAPKAARADFTMTYSGKPFDTTGRYCTPDPPRMNCENGPLQVDLRFGGSFPPGYTGTWGWNTSSSAITSNPSVPSLNLLSGTISESGSPATPVTSLGLQFKNGAVAGIWHITGLAATNAATCTSLAYYATYNGDRMRNRGYDCAQSPVPYYMGENKTPGIWKIIGPPLQPRIMMSGDDITNTPQPVAVVVGQHIELYTNLSTSTIASQTWNATGSPISYTISPSCQPERTPVSCKATSKSLNSSLTKGYTVNFYWLKPGKYTVTYDVTYINGSIGKASANFSVGGVDGTMKTILQPIGPNVYYYIDFDHSLTHPSGWYLGCGVYGRKHCIDFEIKSMIPPQGVEGEFGFIQLVTNIGGSYTTNGGKTVNCGPYSIYYLDNSLPYRFSDKAPHKLTFDSPYILLDLRNQKLRATFRARMFLAWKAKMTGAIWVPIRYVEWFWSGTAIRNGNEWAIDPETRFSGKTEYANQSVLSWPASIVNGFGQCILG